MAVIEQRSTVQIVGEARTVKGAVERFIDTAPDVTLVSLHPRGLDGLEVVRAIHAAAPDAFIVLYAAEETDALYTALDVGASDFVLEQAGSDDLIRAITAGRRGVPARVKRALAARAARPALTAREIAVLELITSGHRLRAISATLRISDHTVKVYLKSAYSKLGVHGRAAAVAAALRSGVVRLAPQRHASSVSAFPVSRTA